MKRRKIDFRVREAAAVYGSAALKGSLEMSPVDALHKIQQGLPMVEFDCLCEMLDLNAEDLARHLSISRSTLMRRRKTGVLDTLESDRLLRYARLYGRAVEVFGKEESAREWLRHPARALGFKSALEMAETELGAREVENLLGRIAYGVFS